MRFEIQSACEADWASMFSWGESHWCLLTSFIPQERGVCHQDTIAQMLAWGHLPHWLTFYKQDTKNNILEKVEKQHDKPMKNSNVRFFFSKELFLLKSFIIFFSIEGITDFILNQFVSNKRLCKHPELETLRWNFYKK